MDNLFTEQCLAYWLFGQDGLTNKLHPLLGVRPKHVVAGSKLWARSWDFHHSPPSGREKERVLVQSGGGRRRTSFGATLGGLSLRRELAAARSSFCRGHRSACSIKLPGVYFALRIIHLQILTPGKKLQSLN